MRDSWSISWGMSTAEQQLFPHLSLSQCLGAKDRFSNSLQINTLHLTTPMCFNFSSQLRATAPGITLWLCILHLSLRLYMTDDLCIFLMCITVRTYQREWMCWHLGRTSKHSNSIEQAPKSNPLPLLPTELTTKARAWISFGDSQMLRSSKVGLVPTTSWASWWSWLSCTQWQSSNTWEDVGRYNKSINQKICKEKFCICFSGFTSVHILPSVQSGCCCGTGFLAGLEHGLVFCGPSFELLIHQRFWLVELRL